MFTLKGSSKIARKVFRCFVAMVEWYHFRISSQVLFDGDELGNSLGGSETNGMEGRCDKGTGNGPLIR
jgi:hypothetical protein